MSKFENDNKLFKATGKIKIKLIDVLKCKNITRYKLSQITGIRYDTICNYCSNNVTLINKEYLKIFCDILECNVEDIIEYQK